MDVWISIVGEQRTEEGTHTVELALGGTMEKEADGVVLSYAEDGENGAVGVRTAVHIRGETVTIEQSGAVNSMLVLEVGKRHLCEYDTGYGILMMGVYTQEIRERFTEDGGELRMRYTLDFNAGFAAAHALRITARRVETE